MFKVSKSVLSAAEKTKSTLEKIKNSEASLKKLSKERMDIVNIHIDDCIRQIKELGLKVYKDSTDSEYTRVNIDYPKSDRGGVIVFKYDGSGSDGVAIKSVVNLGFKGYAEEIDKIVSIDIFNEVKENDKKKAKTLVRFSELLMNLSKVYGIVENSFNKNIPEMRIELNRIDEQTTSIKNASTRNPYIAQKSLMEMVANEIYAHISKKKNFVFVPKKGNELIKDVAKHRGFFFSMDGQADTFGELYRFNIGGESDASYLEVVSDFANIDGIHKVGINKRYLPLFVEKGGFLGYPLSEFNVVGMGKNFKGIAKPSTEENVASSGLKMISPRKNVSNSFSSDPIESVFIAKGGLLGMLALWTDELDGYKKLFVNG